MEIMHSTDLHICPRGKSNEEKDFQCSVQC
jgi:hypothetical protein